MFAIIFKDPDFTPIRKVEVRLVRVCRDYQVYERMWNKIKWIFFNMLPFQVPFYLKYGLRLNPTIRQPCTHTSNLIITTYFWAVLKLQAHGREAEYSFRWNKMRKNTVEVNLAIFIRVYGTLHI